MELNEEVKRLQHELETNRRTMSTPTPVPFDSETKASLGLNTSVLSTSSLKNIDKQDLETLTREQLIVRCQREMASKQNVSPMDRGSLNRV